MCVGPPPEDSLPLIVPPESSESLADAAPRAILAAMAAAASWRLDGVVLVVVADAAGVGEGADDDTVTGRTNDICREIADEEGAIESRFAEGVEPTSADAAFRLDDVRGLTITGVAASGGSDISSSLVVSRRIEID